MKPDDLIITTLQSSTLIDELRDAEIEVLSGIMEVQDFKAGDVIARHGDGIFNADLRDKLMILASGEIEITFMSERGKTTLSLLKPGDLTAIIGFVSGDVSQISADVTASSDSRVLVLDRQKFESLLNTQPAIVYYVMRGIASYVHAIVRRMNMQSVELTSYLYSASRF